MANNAIVHVEFPANNPAESAEFYSKLFGWKLEHDANFDYWMFETEPQRGGGFIKVGDNTAEGGSVTRPGDVLVYVDTESIDASLAQAQELGATVDTARTEIPGMGWFAVFRDPTGNRIGLFEYNVAAMSQGQGQEQVEAVTA